VTDQAPEIAELGLTRLRSGTEHGREAAAELPLVRETAEQRPERPVQELLNEPRVMRLREQAAVEKADRAQDGAARSGGAPFLVAREQLLRDGVAVVVREHVHRCDPALGEQCLVNVGLLG
jgi:hypothetical protein